MAPPESKRERINEKIRETLAAVVGDESDFWYTPDTVVRVDFSSPIVLDRARGPVIYIVRPGVGLNDLSASGAQRARAEAWLQLARIHDVKSTDLYEQTAPIVETIQNRMIRDVKKALAAAWPTWGLDVFALVVTDEDVDEPEEGWATASLRLEYRYSYRSAAP